VWTWLPSIIHVINNTTKTNDDDKDAHHTRSVRVLFSVCMSESERARKRVCVRVRVCACASD
jgi:hypothetical protein